MGSRIRRHTRGGSTQEELGRDELKQIACKLWKDSIERQKSLVQASTTWNSLLMHTIRQFLPSQVIVEEQADTVPQ